MLKKIITPPPPSFFRYRWDKTPSLSPLLNDQPLRRSDVIGYCRNRLVVVQSVAMANGPPACGTPGTIAFSSPVARLQVQVTGTTWSHTYFIWKPITSTTMSALSVADRAVGAVVGSLIADAAGKPKTRNVTIFAGTEATPSVSGTWLVTELQNFKVSDQL